MLVALLDVVTEMMELEVAPGSMLDDVRTEFVVDCEERLDVVSLCVLVSRSA